MTLSRPPDPDNLRIRRANLRQTYPENRHILAEVVSESVLCAFKSQELMNISVICSCSSRLGLNASHSRLKVNKSA